MLLSLERESWGGQRNFPGRSDLCLWTGWKLGFGSTGRRLILFQVKEKRFIEHKRWKSYKKRTLKNSKNVYFHILHYFHKRVFWVGVNWTLKRKNEITTSKMMANMWTVQITVTLFELSSPTAWRAVDTRSNNTIGPWALKIEKSSIRDFKNHGNRNSLLLIVIINININNINFNIRVDSISLILLMTAVSIITLILMMVNKPKHCLATAIACRLRMDH